MLFSIFVMLSALSSGCGADVLDEEYVPRYLWPLLKDGF